MIRISNSFIRFFSDEAFQKRNYKTLKYSTLILFFTSTVFLFVFLSRIQSDYFIDEAFHIPQTLRYCAWNFTEVMYDSEITFDYIICSIIL